MKFCNPFPHIIARNAFGSFFVATELDEFHFHFQYSSRDEIANTSTEIKSMPRFGSLSSPSSYRPSYSGGTYRSAGIKRETLTPTYPSRYSVTPGRDILKDVSTTKKSPQPTLKVSTGKDSSPQTSSRYSVNNSATNKAKIKDNSPCRPAISVSRVQSPLSSKSSSYSRSRSRDPSPADPPKNNFVSSYSKLYPRSSGYGSKLSVSSNGSRGTSPSLAISYMTASDSSARLIKRHSEGKTRKSNSNNSVNSEISKQNEPEEEIIQNENVEMVEVVVVTRGTSPSMCTPVNFTRCRRAELAKTIEKTISRPVKKPKCEDKEVQSDRLDDTTKYCRFYSARSPSPWSPPNYVDTKCNSSGYGRINTSSSRSNSAQNSASPSKFDTDSESPEKSPEKIVINKSRESSVSSKSSSPVSSASKTSTKSSKSKSKSPAYAKIAVPVKSKSSSNKSLPPMAPKSESPVKTIIPASTSTTPNTLQSTPKWPNKDFRKSALNVGPSDRPRKTRHSSVETDSDDHIQRDSMSPANRIDRSSSAGSEVSYSSNNTNNRTEDVTNKLTKLKISPTFSSNTDQTNTNRRDQYAVEQTNDSCNDINNINRLRPLDPNTTSLLRQCDNDEDEFSICETIRRDTIDYAPDETITNNNNLNIKTNEDYQNKLANETTGWTNSDIGDDKSNTYLSYDFSGESNSNMKQKLQYDSGDTAWWMNENDDTTADDVTLNQSESDTRCGSVTTDADSRSSRFWWLSDSNPANEAKKTYRITRIPSGERAWWMDEPTNNAQYEEPSVNYTIKINGNTVNGTEYMKNDENNVTNGEEDIDFWSVIKPKSDIVHRILDQRGANHSYRPNDIPLGARASPEGLEDFNNNTNCAPRYNPINEENSSQKLFISRHQNIDDLLGGASHLSPMLMDTIGYNEDVFEECHPSQVRIHDGTRKTPQVHHIADER